MTPLRQSIAIPVRELHDVGDCRRRALAIAKTVHFDETDAGKVALVVTEFATNLVKHAGGGTVLVRALQSGDDFGLEVMSLDKGPGFNADQCLRDGYSTSGSPGTGLGAVARLAKSLEVYSLPQRGSVLVAALWPSIYGKATPDVTAGAICLPVDGEHECGDGWAIRYSSDHIRVVVSDGLGHGPLAAKATDSALSLFAVNDRSSPAQVIQTFHLALKPTRGAAIAIVDIDLVQNQATFAGIGNIGASLFTGVKSRGMVSLNGIVGHQIARVAEFTYPCAPEDVLVLHSDGLSAHWKMEDYPGLAYRSPSLIAGVFYRDYRRVKDDATIVVLRRS